MSDDQRPVIFATTAIDALDKCNQLGIPMDTVIWVLNYRLLGDVTLDGRDVYFTDTFMMMPAYAEAKAAADQAGPQQQEFDFEGEING